MPARNPRVGKSDVNQRQKSRSPSKHHLKPRVSTMAALDDAHDQRSPSPTAKIKEGCEKCGLGHLHPKKAAASVARIDPAGTNTTVV
jgi:hypothetical protein